MYIYLYKLFRTYHIYTPHYILTHYISMQYYTIHISMLQLQGTAHLSPGVFFPEEVPEQGYWEGVLGRISRSAMEYIIDVL